MAKTESAVNPVNLDNINNAFAQLNATMAPGPGVTTGISVADKLAAFKQMQAVSLNSSLPVDLPKKTGKVGNIAAMFDK